MRRRNIGITLFALVVGVAAIAVAIGTSNANVNSDGNDRGQPLTQDGQDATEVLAAAVRRLLTVDHGFATDGPPPFTSVYVADAFGGVGGTPLEPLELEAIAAAVNESGPTAQYTDDPQELIRELFDGTHPGAVVVTVEALRLEQERAEIELHLWCGSLCGIYLTYEAVEVDGTWIITGPIGPITMS